MIFLTSDVLVLILIILSLCLFTGLFDFLNLNTVYLGRHDHDGYVGFGTAGCYEDYITITDDTFGSCPDCHFSSMYFDIDTWDIGAHHIQFYLDSYELDINNYATKSSDFSYYVNNYCGLPRDPYSWNRCEVPYRVCIQDTGDWFLVKYNLQYESGIPEVVTTTQPEIPDTITSTDQGLIDQIVLIIGSLFNYILVLLGGLFV